MNSLQDVGGGYTQGQLTFVDGDYGADTQGLDYEYPLSQTQSQTQASQLTQPDTQSSKG